MSQPELFDASLQARFDRFRAANPAVEQLFIRFAEEAHQRGRKRIGAKMLAERIRWYTAVETQGDGFKLNNSYVSRFARLVAQLRPDLAHLFETRTLKA